MVVTNVNQQFCSCITTHWVGLEGLLCSYMLPCIKILDLKLFSHNTLYFEQMLFAL